MEKKSVQNQHVPICAFSTCHPSFHKKSIFMLKKLKVNMILTDAGRHTSKNSIGFEYP